MEENQPLELHNEVIDVSTTLIKKENIYIYAATSDNTRKAYRSDIQHFIAWGGLLPSTTEIIIQYLHDHASLLNSRTLARRLISLKQWHVLQGYTDPTDHPTVSKTLKGIKRIHGVPRKKAAGLFFEHLIIISSYLTQSPTLRNIRNNALLLLQFAGALRVSELLAVEIEHLSFNNEGVSILIPKSKTDQENDGITIFIPYSKKTPCPASALRSWIERAGLKDGIVFRNINKSGVIQNKKLSARSIHSIIQVTIRACNLGSDNESYSSHSLRRGFATDASRKKASIASIMRQGRWKSMRTVMEYIEEGERLEDNAANAIFNT